MAKKYFCNQGDILHQNLNFAIVSRVTEPFDAECDTDQMLKDKLLELETTRYMVFWGDHSQIAGEAVVYYKIMNLLYHCHQCQSQLIFSIQNIVHQLTNH